MRQKITFRKDYFLLFIISPLWCMVVSFARILKGDISMIKIFPLIMGMIAFLFPPYSDFARNLDLSYTMINWDIIDIIKDRIDFAVPLINHYFIKLKIPIEIFRFIWIYIVYTILTNMYIDIISRYKISRTTKTWTWIAIFFFIPFYDLVINVRTPFVNCLFLFFFYKVYYCNERKYLIYSILLVFIHFAYIPIIIIFVVSYYYYFKLPNKKIFLLIVFCSIFLIDSGFIENILQGVNFGNAINSKISAYTGEGGWSLSGESYDRMNTSNYKIYKFLSNMVFYYLAFNYIWDKYDKRIDKYINSFLPILILISSIPILYNRYLSFLITPLFLSHIMYIIKYKKDFSYIRKLAMICILTTTINIYAKWNCYVNGHVWAIITPVPYELTLTYNFKTWTNEHLKDSYNIWINKSELSR